MLQELMRKIIKWLDPKLDKYRPAKPTPKPTKYTPRTIEDFIAVLQRTPKSILSNQDRDRIAAIMSFNDRTVSELMVSKNKIPFVNSNEVLGPLTLDKLYKSGFTHFPVIDASNRVIGIIHTEALNALAIKKTDRASKYLDPSVHYLHATDPLSLAVEEIERTGSYYFLVQDDTDNIIGCFTIQMLLDYLLGSSLT